MRRPGSVRRRAAAVDAPTRPVPPRISTRFPSLMLALVELLPFAALPLPAPHQGWHWLFAVGIPTGTSAELRVQGQKGSVNIDFDVLTPGPLLLAASQRTAPLSLL